MNTIISELSRLIGVDAQVDAAFVPAPVEHPLDLRIVFADDEGEFMRLWHGIHDDKQINWRNR